MTDQADLTPAEQAAADVLAADSECSWHLGCDAEDCHEPRARAVVAAVRPLIEADALEALADAATTHGPPSADHLRGLAHITRRGRTLRDWLATEPPVHGGIHHYLSTGCLHGEMTLPDGRTGHQYCQGHTGNAGSKKPASCKFCDAPCWCECHKTNG